MTCMDEQPNDSTFYYPAHIDGCTVVIIRQVRRGFEVVESGRLSFDGTTLWLETQGASREVKDEEINSLQIVVAGNRIPQCLGFDFFRIIEGE